MTSCKQEVGIFSSHLLIFLSILPSDNHVIQLNYNSCSLNQTEITDTERRIIVIINYDNI